MYPREKKICQNSQNLSIKGRVVWLENPTPSDTHNSGRSMLKHKMTFQAHAFGQTLMSKGQIAKARQKHKGCTLGVTLMSKGEIAQDLISLDAALAFMLPALEMRDVTVGTATRDPLAHHSKYVNEVIATFDSLAHPSSFLNDFRAMIEAHGAANIDDEARANIVIAFNTAQLHAQEFVGGRVSLPFAGNYAYTGSDLPRTNGVVSFKPNAIKKDDLKLCITLLVEKIRVLTEQRLEIARICSMWQIAISEKDDTRMTTKLANTVAFTASPIAAQFITRRVYQFKQSDLDAHLLASGLKRKTLKTAFENSELEHHRKTEENVRTLWLLIDKCSPTMKQALQCKTVDAIRSMWKSKLDSSVVLGK